MYELLFYAPRTPPSLADLVNQGWSGASRHEVHAVIRGGKVRVAQEVVRDPDLIPHPGAAVRAEVFEPKHQGGFPEIEVLWEGPDSLVVKKPAGYSSHGQGDGDANQLSALDGVARHLGCPLDQLWPVHRLDKEVGGLWWIAQSREAAARIGAYFEQRHVDKIYRALVPRVAWPSGEITARLDGKKARTRYRTVEEVEGLQRLEVRIETGRKHQIRRHLAAIGAPIIGDGRYGGMMIGGGLRLRSVGLKQEDEGVDVRLDESHDVWQGTMPTTVGRTQDWQLTVSNATIKAMGRGHPWVLTDTETSDLGGVPIGDIATLMAQDGSRHGTVRVEGTGVIAARRWSHQARGPSLEARVASAIDVRTSLSMSARKTNAYRVVHGEADAFPGLHVDRIGPHLRAVVLGGAARTIAKAATLGIREALGLTGAVIVVNHERCDAGTFERVQLIERGEQDDDLSKRVVVLERGLRFWIDLGLSEPNRSRPGTGLFFDQRENRNRLADLVAQREGQAWLNLFCHTGAFSVALLAAGAQRVTSVDLSSHYLGWLDDNLHLNNLDQAQHQSRRMDARRFLEKGGERDKYDGVILDPPTAAAAGRRFWENRKGGALLTQLAIQALGPGGTLLFCRNDRHARGRLVSLVEEAARDCNRSIVSMNQAGPGLDFPVIPSFPEGDSFQGVQVQFD